jgi:hypothetical protein
MSNILPSTSQNLHPHRRRVNPSSTISAIRHVQFRRPVLEHGNRTTRIGNRKGERNGGDVEEKDDVFLEENIGLFRNMAWRERIKHFTWTWFTMTMATGGIANVMYATICDSYWASSGMVWMLIVCPDTRYRRYSGYPIYTPWELFSSS